MKQGECNGSESDSASRGTEQGTRPALPRTVLLRREPLQPSERGVGAAGVKEGSRQKREQGAGPEAEKKNSA